jgi:hypothetical protein
MGRFAIGVLLACFVSSAFADSTPIGRPERDLVAIVNLSLLKKFKLNFQYEEARAIRKIRRELSGRYRRIHLLSGHHANHAEFLRTLAEVEADPEVKAIDAIIYLHGHPGGIGFVDTGFYPMARLRDEILALPTANDGGGAKLRVLYSDACYGASHVDDWLKAGFRAASGSDATDANWSLDLKKYKHPWSDGKSFGEGIRRANSVWATPIMDRIGGGNSHKEAGGAIELTIDARP